MTDDYRKIEERKGAGRKGEFMRKKGIYCRVKEEGPQWRNEKWRRKRGMMGVYMYEKDEYNVLEEGRHQMRRKGRLMDPLERKE